jgi:UDP-GlcNAc:undecaprenyl-phosphate/decaprenyl-phosphate GlcNAc-1-phosphate transferase
VIPIILHFAHKHKWYDQQSHRKIHTTDTPRLGGIGIFLAFFIASMSGFFLIVSPEQIDLWSRGSVALIIAGMAIMHGLGIYDDFVNLPAPLKFSVQVLSGIVVASSGAIIASPVLPFLGAVRLPAMIALPVTILWIVSIANAVNLIDGADGLAGGYSAIAAFFMGLIALGQGNLLTAILAFALVGSLVGFLVFNFPPARIFMGDSGSLFLGFVLAVLPVVGLNGRTDTSGAVFVLVPTLSLLYLPITDTLLAIFRRKSRGLPVHAPDKEHIHHRLMERGFQGKRLVAVVYSGSILFGIAAMSWFTLPRPFGTLINVFLWVVVTIAIVRIGKKRHPQKQ